jgi:hypothetical protein
MWKQNNWLIGLVILSTVIALVFGATYLLSQTGLGQSIGPGGPGSERSERPLPEASNFPAGAPPGGGHGFQPGAAVANIVLNLVKIAFVTWVVAFAIPRLRSLFRQRGYKQGSTPIG